MTAGPRVLVLEEAWAGVSDAIAAAGHRLDPVLMDLEGRLHHDGREVDVESAAAEIGWFSPELFFRKLDVHYLDAMRASRTLKWLQVGRAGIDDPVFPELLGRGVKLSVSNAPAVAISEYVIWAVLDLFQGGDHRRAAQAEGQWRPAPFREIGGTKWVSLGFGSIGREVSRRARAMGAQVTGVRRSGGTDPDADAIVTPDSAAAALGDADVVVVSLPLTSETADALNADFFAGLKEGAVFVNVGRGGLVDEHALRGALDGGRISAALLDVTRVEPLPADSWLWRHPKVKVTAHTSGIGSGLLGRTRSIFVRNIGHYLRGEPLDLEVDSRGG